MRFVLENKIALALAALLLVCSVMMVRRVEVNQTKHLELREAFVLLYHRGYPNEAQRLYARLVRSVQELTDQQLSEDLQRTLLLVDPTTQHPADPIWKYHWTIKNELEIREERGLKRAHEIAGKQ